MRVLLVTGKLAYSTPTTYSIDLARGLRDRGHEVRVAALGVAIVPALEELGIQCYLLRFNVFSYRRLLGFFREFAADVVHATGGHRPLWTGAKLARKLRTPFIHTLHSWLSEDRAGGLPGNLSSVIAVNQDLREHLVNTLNVPKSLVHVIPYGIDGELHRPPPPAEVEGRWPVVGVVGRLEKGRRWDEFIEAAAELRDRGVAVHFMIAGEGPDETRLRKLVQDRGLLELVTFVQPRVTSREMYGVIDVLVMVSDWGGGGLRFLEGMAHGRPIIATGGGEVLSLLGEENICLITPAGDPGCLADAVEELLTDPARRAELGRNAREYVLAQFPMEQQLVRVERCYSEHVAMTTA